MDSGSGSARTVEHGSAEEGVVFACSAFGCVGWMWGSAWRVKMTLTCGE
jgi:hypothetical protein